MGVTRNRYIMRAGRVLAQRRGGARATALIVSCALFMEQLDSTVLATALPRMARTFVVDPLHMNIALTAYLLSLAVFIPVSGKLADRFGSRNVFRGAIALFTLGSILCGQADSLAFLVGARILQGIGGAMMVPVGRLVLLRTVAKADLVSAMAWLLLPATIGPVVGPPVGGLIVTYLSWRWIFYINVPIGIAGILLATVFIEDTRDGGSGDLDAAGWLLSAVSLACLMFGLEMISRGAASGIMASAILAVGVACGVLYVLYARRHPDPILDFRLLRIPTFGLSAIGGSLSRISAGATPFLLPMMMQLGFGMSAAQSGFVTFASAAGSLLMRLGATFLLKRFGFRRTMVWNGLIAASFLLAYAAFRPSWPIAAIYAVLVTGGFFQSLQFIAYNTIAYADIPRARMSAATSFYTAFQQFTLTLGICCSAGVLAVSIAVRGHAHAQLSDFSAAFITVGLVSLLAAPACARLPENAGQEMSGHRT
jgi:EmrB/QacA subfamily drug resistance transporter